jgi:dihydropteroate synthase
MDLQAPKIMGILNLTPDSFYDGGKAKDLDSLLRRAEAMLNAGADFLDLGAYSSRPGADFVPEDEEAHRLLGVVEALMQHFPEALLSIDTFRAKIAQEALDRGAALINDITAGHGDEAMLSTVGKYQAPFVMMHMRGTPQTMQQHTDYDDLMGSIFKYFSERIQAAYLNQIHDVILDPGYGFAKTLEQNYQLLKHASELLVFEKPVLTGVSRKSMIYKLLDSSPEKALNGTTALHMIALQQGSKILRAHDVAEAAECIRIYKMLAP